MRAFKPAKAPWFDQIPSDWDEAPLFTYFRERRSKNKGMVETNVLSLSYGSIKRRNVDSGTGLLPESFETYQIVEPGDIVMRLTDLQNDKRSLRTGLVGERGIVTSAYVALATNQRTDSRFAHYLLHSLDTTKVFYGLGAGVRQTMGYGDLSGIPLAMPNRLEQRRVADYLDSEAARIDSLVDRKQRFIDLLLEKRTALITHAVTKGLDPDVEMKDSGVEWLDAVPAQWDLKPLKQLIHTCQNGCWGEEPGNADTDVFCVRAADFDRHAMLVNPNKLPLRGLTGRELVKNGLSRGNLVIEKSGGGDDQPVGKVVLFDVPNIDAVCSNFQAKIVLSAEVRPEYVTYLFEALYATRVNRRYIKQTTGLQNLDVKAYFAENVPLSGVSEQTQIVEYLSAKLAVLDELVSQTRKSSSLLKEYRTALVFAAVTGQIEIPAADIGEEVA